MKRRPILLLLVLQIVFLILAIPDLRAQSRAERSVRLILDQQTAAWNRGDLEGFMHGYWESDSLMYIGKSGVTYGYASTLASYRRNYGDTARMGKLRFDLIQVRRLSARYFHVVGKWSLKRSAGDVGGHYTLLFRKIRGEWVIVSDHSS
jgi:ketosteroid isomerase-like protein